MGQEVCPILTLSLATVPSCPSVVRMASGRRGPPPRGSPATPHTEKTQRKGSVNAGTAQTQEKNKIFFEKNQKGLLQPHDKTHHGEAKVNFCYISGDFVYRHHVQPVVKQYVPTEGPFPIPLKYIYVTRTTDTNLDAMSKKHIEDYRNFDEDRRTVGCMDRFHKIHFIK